MMGVRVWSMYYVLHVVVQYIVPGSNRHGGKICRASFQERNEKVRPGFKYLPPHVVVMRGIARS